MITPPLLSHRQVMARFRWYRAMVGGSWVKISHAGRTLWKRLEPAEDPDQAWSKRILEREFYSPFDPGQFHDGFHKLDELYDHRCLLFCAFLKVYGGWKSITHADGSRYAGWFVAGCELNGRPITYHLPLKLWDSCPVVVLDRGKEFDGHTSADVLARLEEFCSK